MEIPAFTWWIEKNELKKPDEEGILPGVVEGEARIHWLQGFDWLIDWFDWRTDYNSSLDL